MAGMPLSSISAILKASDFSELDREGYRFSTAATVYNNGAQVLNICAFLMILIELISAEKTISNLDSIPNVNLYALWAKKRTIKTLSNLDTISNVSRYAPLAK